MDWGKAMEIITEGNVEEYRQVLGLPSIATRDDLQRCYRSAMRCHHPDLHGGSGEMARQINEAHDYLLKHPQRISRPPRVKVPFRIPVEDFPWPSVDTPTWMPAPAVEQSWLVEHTSWGLGNVLFATLRWAVILYVATWAFAIAGYTITTIIPWLLRVLG